HLLIEMMRYLPEENLVIVGNWGGKYSQQMKDRIAELSLHNVFPLAHVSNADKAALFRRCRGFLFPSLCEGFGLPPIEAMYFGKPVFLSPCTSLPEIGGPENCFFDDLTPEPMAETVRSRLKRFADDAKASERILAWAQRFDWNRCVDGYLRYYLDILQDSRTRLR
ncbi:MAG: glycosyltransferase, partial [Bacteroidales bacterium]|nr:glycosyltransferase [Bacteroidales bacterium]